VNILGSIPFSYELLTSLFHRDVVGSDAISLGVLSLVAFSCILNLDLRDDAFSSTLCGPR